MYPKVWTEISLRLEGIFMKWTFEQKLAWAKAYIAGGFVPIPTGFSGSLEGWHHRIGKWVRVLL